jgi:hypothetical protein
VEAEPFACAQSVNLTTLDHLVEKLAIEHITYLKMDVEGFENLVLHGGRRTLEAGMVDMLYLEYGELSVRPRNIYLSIHGWDTEAAPRQGAHASPDITRPSPR